MNFSDIKSSSARYLYNIAGWRTNRKIVVIESDDWGSIRMPSKEVYRGCIEAGYPVDKTEYERYDSILSKNDLELLFEMLSQYTDKNGNHPTITANCVVANPDFEKIEKDNFKNYYYEPITDTFKRYPEHDNNFELWHEGIDSKIFFPQFHAREHLNVSLFMEALNRGDRDIHFGFKHRLLGCIPHGMVAGGNYYVEATKYNSVADREQKLSYILEGLDLFEQLFGYRSESIIPTNYIWSPDFNQVVFEKGVKVIQGIRKMREPISGGKFQYHSYFLGQRNHLGQIHLTRNALFEPSMFKLEIKDPTDRCLSNIAIAFRMKKPAIISSHRINYAGFVDEKNRDRTLRMMNSLFKGALRRWPDIEFMTTTQLGRVINSHK